VKFEDVDDNEIISESGPAEIYSVYFVEMVDAVNRV
jgi:hypothetical protein